MRRVITERHTRASGLLDETLSERRHSAIDEDKDENNDDGDQETSDDNDEEEETPEAGDSQMAHLNPEHMATMVQMLALMSVGDDTGLIALLETTLR